MIVSPILVRQQIEHLQRKYPELWADEDEQFLADVIEGETDLNEVVSRLLRKRGEARAINKGLCAYASDVLDRAARAAKQADAQDELIAELLKLAGLEKLKLPEATAYFANGAIRTVIPDDTAVPDAFCRIKREPDKTKIKAALEAGERLNWASLEQSEKHLVIRTK
jgi:hypothetical protein